MGKHTHRQRKQKSRVKRHLAAVSLLAIVCCLFTACEERSDLALPQTREMAKGHKEEPVVRETAASPGGADAASLTVRFMDVGQGNAILIQCGGHYMLVDGGDWSKSSYVVSYLKKQGIKSFDYVMASHYDDDHLHGLVGVLKKFDCDLVLDADYEADTWIYRSFVSVVKRENFQEIHPKVGQTYPLGNAQFTIVCPKAYDYEVENDNSIGFRLTYGDTSFLICGDASQASEQDMIASGQNLKSDVYLASHHGSNSSSTEAFLKAVDPDAIVISAAFGNPYGHPAKDAMERICATDADIYRTDLQGEITAVSDGKTITFMEQPAWNENCGTVVAGGS